MTPSSVRVVLAHGLAAAQRPAAPYRLAHHERDDFVAVVAGERLAGLAMAALDDGVIKADERTFDEMVALHERELADSLRLEGMLCAIADLFAARAIEVRVLKGPAFARQMFRDPAQRLFGDVDLLVRGSAWDAAAQALTDVGGRRRFAEPRPGFTARFGKGVCFEMPCGLEVDLHRAFVAGPVGVVGDPDALFDDPAAIELAGRSVATLSREGSLLHACTHAILGRREPRLVPLRDVAQIVECGVDRARFVALAGAFELGAVAAQALIASEDLLGIRVDATLRQWARERRPSKAELRTLAVYASERRSYPLQALAAARAVPGWRARASYTGALAFPRRGYLAQRERSYARRVARAARVLVHPGRRQ